MNAVERKRAIAVRTEAQSAAYEVEVGVGLLANVGDHVRGAVGQRARRAFVVSNRRVWTLYGSQVAEGLQRCGFDVVHWLMGEGERHKNLRTVGKALERLTEARFERNDVVVALGGGVIGDLAGFVAAIYLRGLALVQVPTTLLAQIDASVGGKTGVNMRAGKNLVGAFHQPRAVIVDVETLKSLPRRELTAGWCEAIKHGAVGSRALFEATRDRLATGKPLDDSEALADLIAAHCAFKAEIVSGDEREEMTRTDRRSRRILNFGHTVGHALEAATGYRRLRHGEAVGYGMMAAGEISSRLGLLARAELEELCAAIGLAGRLPKLTSLDLDAVLAALRLDKKSLGGELHWVLLEGIGCARVVPEREVEPSAVRAALRSILG